MSNPELLLSNQLCFMFYRAEKAIMSKYRTLLAELGLTYPQYLAMLVMWEKRSATVGDVCDALRLDTGTVSPLLKRLELAGLVERRRDKSDERSVTIALTPEGEAMEARAAKVPGSLARCVGLEPEEYLEWRARMSGLLERLEASPAETCGDRA